MKKNLNILFLSTFTMLIIFSLLSSSSVKAVETPDLTIEVQGDAIQTHLQSNTRTMFCFQERTRLTICANTGLELDINCDALGIGEKDVVIEVEGTGELKLTMTCTREEAQLGLMKGNLKRVRNRNTYRYLEGFCIKMDCTANCKCECNCDPDCTCECDCQCKCDNDCQCKCDYKCNCDPDCICECDCQCKCDSDCQCNPECDGNFLKARLMIRATNQNRFAHWVYFDNENEELVAVPTINQDGYLTAETSVLSTWTLLVPEETTSVIATTVGIASVFTIGIIAISVFYFKRKSIGN